LFEGGQSLIGLRYRSFSSPLFHFPFPFRPRRVLVFASLKFLFLFRQLSCWFGGHWFVHLSSIFFFAASSPLSASRSPFNVYSFLPLLLNLMGFFVLEFSAFPSRLLPFPSSVSPVTPFLAACPPFSSSFYVPPLNAYRFLSPFQRPRVPLTAFCSTAITFVVSWICPARQGGGSLLWRFFPPS